MLWTEKEVKSSPVSRSSHGVSIVDDTVYMFGGEHEARTPVANDLHSLDLSQATLEWRKVAVTGDVPSARFGHGQCSVGPFLYVFGGRQGTAIDEKLLNDLYKFDTRTSVWSQVHVSGDVPCPRSFHSMVARGSSIFVFGGCPETGRLADLHHYDTETSTWTRLETGPMEGRGGTPFVATPAGDLFVIGGFAGREMGDIHKYNISTNKWETMKESLPTACSVAVVEFVTDKIVLVGGELEPSARGHAGAGNFSDKAIVLNVKDGVKVEAECQGPSSRGWSSGAVWRSPSGDKMVVFGGLTGDDENPIRLGDLWIGSF